MAIRYDKKLNQEINKTIKNFNQKITRLEKEGRELLPNKIYKKELIEGVTNRNELKRKLKELQRFSIRGAEEVVETVGGVKLTKYELTNLKKESSRVKQNITREINRLKVEKPKIFGKEQSATFSQMGDAEYLNLQARRKALEKNIQRLSREEFERYKKLIEKTSRNQLYMNSVFKENYYKMLTDLGYYFNYDEKKLDVLKKELLNLKPNEFIKLFREDKSIRAILDYYPMATNTFKGINPADIKQDVVLLYDNLYDNLNEILKDYA